MSAQPTTTADGERESVKPRVIAAEGLRFLQAAGVIPLIIGVRWAIPAAQATTDGPRAVVLFLAAMMIMLGLALVVWPARAVGVRISADGVTSNNLTTKPSSHPGKRSTGSSTAATTTMIACT